MKKTSLIILSIFLIFNFSCDFRESPKQALKTLKQFVKNDDWKSFAEKTVFISEIKEYDGFFGYNVYYMYPFEVGVLSEEAKELFLKDPKAMEMDDFSYDEIIFTKEVENRILVKAIANYNVFGQAKQVVKYFCFYRKEDGKLYLLMKIDTRKIEDKVRMRMYMFNDNLLDEPFDGMRYKRFIIVDRRVAGKDPIKIKLNEQLSVDDWLINGFDHINKRYKDNFTTK